MYAVTVYSWVREIFHDADERLVIEKVLIDRMNNLVAPFVELENFQPVLDGVLVAEIPRMIDHLAGGGGEKKMMEPVNARCFSSGGLRVQGRKGRSQAPSLKQH